MAKIGFYLILAPLYVISLLPDKILYCISDFSAFFMRKIIRYRQDIVRVNVARSFPDYKYGKIEEIIKDFYINFTDVFIELLSSISATREKHSSISELENPDCLQKFHDLGKSVMIVLGHQANWENISIANFSSSGYESKNFRFVYKKMSHKIPDMIIKWMRMQQMDGELVESNEIAKYMFNHKEEQLCYFLVADQSPLPGAKFVVDFLNQPTLMMNGPEQLSWKFNIPVAFLNSRRVSRGKYKFTLSVITDDPSNTEEGEITRKFAALLEAGIRKHPSDWLWSHKRWKRSLNDLKNSSKRNDG